MREARRREREEEEGERPSSAELTRAEEWGALRPARLPNVLGEASKDRREFRPLGGSTELASDISFALTRACRRATPLELR